MSAGLRAAARDYLSERRARGYRLDDHEWLLGAFLDGLEARGATRITVAGALAFATARPETSRCWQAKRLAVVREFAWYVHGTDPAAAEPIPAGLINARTARRVPYLYSEEQIARLMSAAALLPARMLAASMQTLIGVLASTGLRSGEAGALDVGDLDAAAQLLTVTGKYGRIRLVALHSTTVQALTGYLRIRASRAVPAGPLLIGETGHRLNLTMARNIFRSLTRQCRLAPQPGCGAPRLHDFRHRFAVNTLIDVHRQGRDVDACIAVLATHLGHVSPVHTYWYLTVTPELADAVSERVALYYQKGRRQ
jgi:integrase